LKALAALVPSAAWSEITITIIIGLHVKQHTPAVFFHRQNAGSNEVLQPFILAQPAACFHKT